MLAVSTRIKGHHCCEFYRDKARRGFS